MSRYRRGLGALAGLAGGSLVAGVPWRGAARGIRAIADSDATGLAVAVIAEFLVESPLISTVLTWLFVLGILYTYTDLLYLRRVAALTERRSFRLLTAGFAGAFAVVISRASEMLLLLAGFGLILTGLVAFSLYLLGSDVDPFDPDGVTLPFLARMGGKTPEELLAELAAASGIYRRISAASFYLAPAAIFTASCFVLGAVVLTLLELYPVPELTVLAVAGLSAVEATTPVDVSGRVRSGLRLETRIVEPLAAATSNVEGIAMTLLCVIQLFLSALTFAAGVGLVREFLTHEGWGNVVDHLGIVGSANAVAIIAVLAVVGMLVVSMLVWGAYGVLFWVRELQRLPALVGSEAAATPPAVARIPGAMLPANALALTAVVGVAIGVMPRLETAEGLAGVPLALSAAYLAVTGSLLVACLWTLRSAWTRPEPQPVDRERAVFAVAFVGTFLTMAVISLSLGVISTAEAVAVAAVSVVALVVVVWGPRFALETTEAESVGPISGDAAFTGAVVAVCVLGAGFLEWYYPSGSPLLPGSILAFATAVVVFYALGRRQ